MRKRYDKGKQLWLFSYKIGLPSWKKGLTKDTCPSIAAQASKRIGKNKNNDAAYALLSQKLTGRRKETHPSVASMIEKLKGRIVWNKGLTKDTNPIIAARSEKVRGRTKDNDPSVARAAAKKTGRTKYTHEYLAESGRKKSQYVGELASNWIDGRSFLPYSPGFNKLTKARVRERDNHICQGCGITEDKHQQITKLHSVLAIHHIDYSKDNASESNLISLCTKCNSAANKDREFWSAFYHDKLCANTIKWF